MSFEAWAGGTLDGISAPVDQVNVDTLWAWSGAESGDNRMRWNNPLNTTQPWNGAIDQNSVGVKYYLTVADGIGATVLTLGNGYYPLILDRLRRSVPYTQWQDCCPELGTWGTGCAWLNHRYGDAPRVAGGIELDQATFNALVAGSPLANLLGGVTSTYNAVIAGQKAILAVLGSGGTGQLSAQDELLLREAHDAAQQSLADLRAIFKPAA